MIADLTPDSEIYPGWTLRRFLTHLTGWDDVTATTLRTHARGETLDLDHIVKEWELAREELKAALCALTPEQMAAPLLHPWGCVSTVARLVNIKIHHEGVEHAEELRAMRTAAQ